MRALASGVAALVTGHAARDEVTAALAREFDARTLALTDSGTSALVLALRMVAARGERVAFPAYSCVDLIAAARRAGVRMSLYDLDPATLSPDIDSLRRAALGGVAAIVVAHLYGFPADVPAARAVAAEAGVPLIEDAAQQAGATLGGVRAGAMGDLVVLSFGRGKGMTAGSGGALLGRDPAFDDRVAGALEHARGRRGARPLLTAVAGHLLGRPALYAIPAAIPALHLGETVYSEAGEPGPLPDAAVAMLAHAIAAAPAHLETRRRHAALLAGPAAASRRAMPIRPLPGAEPGYLRFPVLASYHTPRVPQLGVVGAYPRSLAEQPEVAGVLADTADDVPGSRELGRRLVTLPTHHLLTQRDMKRLVRWLEAW